MPSMPFRSSMAPQSVPVSIKQQGGQKKKTGSRQRAPPFPEAGQEADRTSAVQAQERTGGNSSSPLEDSFEDCIEHDSGLCASDNPSAKHPSVSVAVCCAGCEGVRHGLMSVEAAL